MWHAFPRWECYPRRQPRVTFPPRVEQQAYIMLYHYHMNNMYTCNIHVTSQHMWPGSRGVVSAHCTRLAVQDFQAQTSRWGRIRTVNTVYIGHPLLYRFMTRTYSTWYDLSNLMSIFMLMSNSSVFTIHVKQQFPKHMWHMWQLVCSAPFKSKLQKLCKVSPSAENGKYGSVYLNSTRLTPGLFPLYV